MSLMFKWLESLAVEYTITDSCIRHTSPHSTCTTCIDSCPNTAITLKDSNVTIDETLCTTCGNCVVMCPVSAIDGIGPKRKIENNYLFQDNNTPLLTKELLVYKNLGINTVVSTSQMTTEWCTIINVANEYFKSINENIVEIIENYEPQEQILDRRELFKSFRNKSVQYSKEFTPADWRMDAQRWRLPQHYSEHAFYDILIHEEKCTLCGICNSLCPGLAIMKTESTFTFETQKCLGCNLCIDTCPEGAIAIKKHVQEKKIIELPISLLSCRECGEQFPSLEQTKETCMMCSIKVPNALSAFG